MKKILLVLTLVALQADGYVYAEPLKGKVQHEAEQPIYEGGLFDRQEIGTMPAGIRFDDSVEPAGPEFKLHKLFSSINLPVEDKEDTWYQIPRWRAGSFHREKQIDHTLSGDIESISRADHVYGMQVDRNGGIWHHMSWPRITRISLDGYSQYKIINRYEPVTMSDNEYCVKICSTNIDVDDKTGKVIRVGKQEEFDRYFPAGNGIARGNCLIQGFSQHGRPNTTIERCSVEEELTKPFAVVNTFRGKNLKESFCNYLQSHDKATLIPN